MGVVTNNLTARNDVEMNPRLYVIANRVEARIFKDSPFELVKTLVNNLGREKNKVLRTDKPGWSRSRFSKSSGIHAMTGEKNPHEEAAVQFARKISRYIERQKNIHAFDQMVIAAEAKMMGRIRSQLDVRVAEDVRWLKKDFGHLSSSEIGVALGIGPKRKGIRGEGLQT